MIQRVKEICTYVSRGCTPDYVDESPYAVMNQATFSKGYIDTSKLRFSSKNPAEAHIQKGDLLMASTGGGVLGKVLYFGEGEPDNFYADSHVSILRDSRHKNNMKFLYYYFMNRFDEINATMVKGSTNQTELQRNYLIAHEIDIPKKERQDAIVAYLDKQLSSTNNRICLRERELQTLIKLKQSEINSVITRGLNATVPMKDSGIDWIGQIPAHWEISRIKDVASLGSGTTPKSGVDKYYDNGTIPWLNTSDVQNRLITQSTYFITEKAVEDYPVLHYYPENTVLLAMYGGGTIGNVGLMTFPAMINQACCAITPKKGLDSKYLYYYLLNKQKWIVSTGFGGTQINLSQKLIAQYYIAIPPIDEQIRIVEFLDSKCQQLDDAYANIELQISKLKLLKKALINEVISGQRTL